MEQHSKRRRDGFTLVELLVVIGIIVVLIALLLPAIGLVRDRGRSAQCQSNLAEIGIAFAQANSKQPQPVRSSEWTNRLGNLLGRDATQLYLEDQTDLFICPADFGTTESTSYGMNHRAHRMQGGDGTKIVMLDYATYEAKLVVSTVAEQDDWSSMAPTDRHRGNLNVLQYGGSVSTYDPDEIDPRYCKPFLDYWRPLRDFGTMLEDCTAGQPSSSDGTDGASSGGGTTGGGTDGGTDGSSTGGTPGTTEPCESSGILARYYSPNNDWTGVYYERADDTVHLPFGAYGYGPVAPYTDCTAYPMWCELLPYNTEGLIPSATPSASRVGSAVWAGSVKADTTDTYTFYLSSDNESWLFLNGTQVVHRAAGGAGGVNQSSSATFSMQAGEWVDIELRVQEYGFGSPNHVSLRWSASTLSLTEIPRDNLCEGSF